MLPAPPAAPAPFLLLGWASAQTASAIASNSSQHSNFRLMTPRKRQQALRGLDASNRTSIWTPKRRATGSHQVILEELYNLKLRRNTEHTHARTVTSLSPRKVLPLAPWAKASSQNRPFRPSAHQTSLFGGYTASVDSKARPVFDEGGVTVPIWIAFMDILPSWAFSRDVFHVWARTCQGG